ncbi:MAG TPA: acyl-CoA thioesterase [Burkholderiales bacterium]|nr:acyl-CoA thioesterase [Burkholderiales bacterium]
MRNPKPKLETQAKRPQPVRDVPSRLEIVVDFADCDPARIVFYPHYFNWFDRASERLFRERGMAWPELWARYQLAGFPIVDASAKFLGPARFGDTITLESWIGEWRSKLFIVEHRVHNAGDLIVEGRELRVWALRDPNNPEGMKAGVIPPEIIERFRN